eukprot:236568_1
MELKPSNLILALDETIEFISSYDNKHKTELTSSSIRYSQTDLLVHGYSRAHITMVLISKIFEFFGQKLDIIGIGSNLNGEFGLNRHRLNLEIRSKYESFKYKNINIYKNCIYQNNSMHLIHDKISNEIYCAGKNSFGQCGINSKKERNILSLTKNDWKSDEYINTISEGMNSDSVFYVTNAQKIYMSGRNRDVHCFDGNNGLEKNYGIFYAAKMTNFFMSNNLRIKKIGTGARHLLILCTNGQIFSCGANDRGQCGILTENNQDIFSLTLVSDLKNYCLDIGCLGSSNLCLCKSLNNTIQLWVFGEDRFCALSLVDFLSESDESEEDIEEEEEMCARTPTLHEYFIQYNYIIKEIVCGGGHSIVITKDGKCVVFGDNQYGQCGNGYDEDRPYSYQNEINIENENIVTAFCGYFHSILLTKKNNLYTFGSNECNECSIINKKEIIDKAYSLKRNEIGLKQNAFIVNIIAGVQSTIILYEDAE